MDIKGTIVLTGGTGFLGYHLVPELVRAGYRVKLMKRSSLHPAMQVLPFEAKAVDSDFSNIDELASHCDGAIAVIHAAGLVSYDRKDQARMGEVHVGLTARMIEAAKRAQVRRFVHVSSIVTIGHGKTPRDETAEFNASGLRLAYWDTKFEAERVALAAQAPDFDVVVVNPGSLLGPGEKNGQLLPFIKKLAASERPVLPDGGSDFLDCADAARGTLLALEKGKGGQRYILGAENLTYAQFHSKLRAAFGLASKPRVLPTGLLTSASKVLQAFESISGIDLPVNAARLRRVNGVFMFHDLAKARQELGYQPGSIEPALRLMLKE